MTSGRRRRRPWLVFGTPDVALRGHAAGVDAILSVHARDQAKLSRAGHPCLSPRQAVVSIVTSGPEPRQLVLRQAAPNRQCGAGAGAAEEAGRRQRLSEEGFEQALAGFVGGSEASAAGTFAATQSLASRKH
jgi:hypothetical protein